MPKQFKLALLAIAGTIPFLGLTSAPAVPVATMVPAASPYAGVPGEVSVLTYNVKGLPWPVARGRDAAFAQIEKRLTAMRADGDQPRIIVLQEAFTDRAKEIGLRSGYRYGASGPSQTTAPAVDKKGDPVLFLRDASPLKGETEGKWLDGGLMVFSDYPIVAVRRTAFPASACAGYDCLANKGALLVELKIPGRPVPVTLVATHLNSRRGAGVDEQRSLQAYKRQIAVLSQFVSTHRQSASPLIVAGDFNASSVARRQALAQMPFLSSGTTDPNAVRSGLDLLRPSLAPNGKTAAEAAYISRRGRDWQFFLNGARTPVKPVSLRIPFGRENDGSMLSDHLGFSIAYSIGGKT